MSPFAGEGANQAMLDGALLAKAISQGTPISEFEKGMMQRVAGAAAESQTNLEAFMNDNSPETAIRRLKEMAQERKAG